MTRLVASGSVSVVDAVPFDDSTSARVPDAVLSGVALPALVGVTAMDSASMMTLGTTVVVICGGLHRRRDGCQ